MRRLFLKIFAIFWIAQSLIFAITTLLILRHRFPRPDAMSDALAASLQVRAQRDVAAFERGGCRAFFAGVDASKVALLNGAQQPLCGRAGPVVAFTGRFEGAPVDDSFVWSVPVVSPSGQHYVFQFRGPRGHHSFSLSHELLHFSFPQLPVAIAISGLTTFVLTFLFTQPVVSLRRAARTLAEGDLSTRVAETSGIARGGPDEFQALIQDFNHMAGRLESLVAAHKLLLRDVSHELRSPLARLGVALELAHEDAADQKTKHLERIEREADRLNQLINQLLTLSSMEAVEEPRRQEPVSLNEVLDDVIADAVYEAQQRGCSVHAEMQGEFTVLGDPELLHRGLENVVRNAVRYTDPGTTVQVRLAPVPDGAGKTAVLEVQDHGPGIPEAERKAVLKPFYRVDPARSRITGGFGIGLAITERVVKLHRGELTIADPVEGGALVRITLPVV